LVAIWAPEIAERPGPRYIAIADAISEDLAEGRLAPGARLPTHRDLADRLRVTVGTVSRGYGEAARRGLITGEVGRGTFVRQWAPDQPAIASAGASTDVVNLGMNHPPLSFDPAHRRALQDALLSLARREDVSPLLGYPPDGGSLPHREAGAAWIGRTGLEAPADRVLVSSGSQHGVTTVFTALLKPGDLVLTEALTYPGMKAAAALLHLRLQGLPLDADGLRPDALEAACRSGGAKALYCVPTIHNPTASVVPLGRRREIAAIAETHGLLIVEDDIHALLPEERPLPISAFAPDLSYYLTSTSKTLAPGLRVGYILAPQGAADRIAAAIRATTWAAAPLMAEIASAWIRDGTADSIVRERRREAAARQALAREVLGPADIQAHPQGHHLWLRLPDAWRSESFAAAARRRGVMVTPSEPFVVGRSAAPPAVRVCLGVPASRGELERGLRLVAETLATSPAEGFPV
jgi:DNA-binding transcriptional MocR family regulator